MTWPLISAHHTPWAKAHGLAKAITSGRGGAQGPMQEGTAAALLVARPASLAQSPCSSTAWGSLDPAV